MRRSYLTALAAKAPVPGERLGAIDVGSNSIRLLVAEFDPQSGINVIDEVKDQPRLAAGLAESHRLDEFAMARAIQALTRMREVAERRGVRRIAAVATSAVREAENGKSFVDRVRREVGIPLKIIDTDAEAALSWRSVAHHFPLTSGRALVADIGGGSLELIGAVNGLIELNRSLPLGAVRLTEKYLFETKSRQREVERLRAKVYKQLKKAVRWREWSNVMVVGSGGTFTNLGRMALARRGHGFEAVHGEIVKTAEVEQLLEWLCSLSVERRRSVPGLNPQRADIILAGLAVTAELLKLVEARNLTVSAFGLREGLLLEMIGDSAPRTSDPLRAMREFVDRCQVDRRHVEQVRVLALTLFDRLCDDLGADPEERPLLEAAALLHDVGQVVSYRKHHRHSFQLILNAERLNLTSRDRYLVALISRYHRRKGPSRKHKEFTRLIPEEQAIVRRLAGLLRVADGLDRGHTSAVERVATRLTKGKLTIRAVPKHRGADLELECWGATRKSDVLAKELRRDIVVLPAVVG
ncbi:MAG TPA: Ppx/GppA phosphatase family protein [Gemmatimonadales bacterium]|jgi:exopolyphosphatase/guanosine-5'-triphosphate,3'-diphosphate pyrophosphatase|nr:Ppx/GppA phosphatase family protein [Gemmatimonadales bacterium]HEV8598788.1 Ppx/GppA phosphatase family protein [Gemmatimonadales bacterium]